MEIHLSDVDIVWKAGKFTDIDKVELSSFQRLLTDMIYTSDKIIYTGKLGSKVLKNRTGKIGVIWRPNKFSLKRYL
jgi:hypothetical protein